MQDIYATTAVRDDLRGELARKTDEWHVAVKALAETTEAKAKTDAEYEQLCRHYNEMRQRENNQRSELHNLKAKYYRELEAAEADKPQTCGFTDMLVTTAQHTLDELKKENELLLAGNESLTRKLADSEKRLDVISRSNAMFVDELKEAKEVFAFKNEQIDKQSIAIADLQNRNAWQADTIRSYERYAKAQSAETAELKELIQAEAASSVELQKRIKTQSDTIAAYQRDLNKSLESERNLRSAIANAKAELSQNPLPF